AKSESAPGKAVDKPAKGRTAYKQGLADREAAKAKSVEADDEPSETATSLKQASSKKGAAQKSKAVAKAAGNERDIEVEVDEDLTKELQTLQASIQNEEQQLEA